MSGARNHHSYTPIDLNPPPRALNSLGEQLAEAHLRSTIDLANVSEQNRLVKAIPPLATIDFSQSNRPLRDRAFGSTAPPH
jgi:hypothetical protein